MKYAAVAVALLVPASIQAQTRLNTLRLTCAQARAQVTAQGAAVLYTGPTTFERFVAGPNMCVLGETTETAFAPTVDAPMCPVGLRCRPSFLDEMDQPK